MRNIRRRLALATVLAVLASLAGVRPAFAADAVPYNDPNATGFLVLYDKAGNAIKGGNVKDHPFAWKIVSSKAAPKPYDGNGRVATVYLYTPHEGKPPTQWSGDTITAGVAYPDPAHPTATATEKDYSLQDYLDEFPPKWNGILQLRMVLGVPGLPVQTVHYASTDIRVSGQTWHVVGGGPGAGPGGANIPGTGGGAANADSGAGSGGPGSADTNPLANILPGLGTPGGLVVAALAIVALVLVGFLWRRRSGGGRRLSKRQAEQQQEEESLPV
jgi:hypothetical protein